jgi:NAD-dependent dihydropyrimidine dehydrogenase PreA subunit
MRQLKDLLLDIIQLLFRMIPHPTTPRLILIGNPNRQSPVLVTTNCSLTVRRLQRTLKRENCYLLVAPAQGINVWCGSVGRHFDAESVISIVQTSGIASCVDHRTLVLPVLSAPSINRADLQKRLQWSVRFGPARASLIPQFLHSGMVLTPEMSLVRFPAMDRMEMAVAMACSIILRFSVWSALLWRLTGFLVFSASVLVLSFLQTGLYKETASHRRLRDEFAIHGLAFTVPCLVLILLRVPLFSWGLLPALLLGAAAQYLVTAALPGYTPFKQCSYSKAFYGHEPISIGVELEKCIGTSCSICVEVCPVDCFGELTGNPALVDIVKPERCVECGACLVQCPTRAVVNLHGQLSETEAARSGCAA